jgi:hypothetical protein
MLESSFEQKSTRQDHKNTTSWFRVFSEGFNEEGRDSSEERVMYPESAEDRITSVRRRISGR